MSANRPKIEPDHSLVATELEIRPEWTDANGHMNVAYYVLAFDRATDAFYDALGIGWPYLERERKSLFTLAMNVDYVREVMAGSPRAHREPVARPRSQARPLFPRDARCT